MPERQCFGCTNQDIWGCNATRHVTTEDDPESEFDVDTKEWVRWKNGALYSLEIDGQNTRACPRQHIHQNPLFWRRLLMLYGMYSKGFLPEKGSVLDQSHQLLELFRILDIANHECDEQESKPERTKGNPFTARDKPNGRNT